jgi:sulfate adenylyltransferase
LSFSKRSDTLFIDKEALSSLAIVQEGLLAPVTGLMGSKEAQEVDTTKQYKGLPMPFSFILAPKGKVNEQHIQQFKKNQKITLICDEIKVGELIVDEIFKIDPKQRVQNIYATTDKENPAAQRALSRLGEWAVSGEYKVEYPQIQDSIELVKNKIKQTNAQNISAIMLGANPLNRAHERIIRQSLDSTDLLVIFLIKPFTEEGLAYKIRKESLEIFVDNFLPNNKVVIVPFENSYIFAGSNELVLDATVAKNYGCTKLIVGRNHRALGMIYNSKNQMDTIFDTIKNIGINIKLLDEYVYCDMCKTLVNTNTCPHGQHHHTHYHYKPLMELIKSGILPPPILVRKEISSHIMSSLYPNRVKNLQETYDMIFPNSGLLEKRDEKDFYIKLIELYQTSSLT